jgi:hypothetical protein
MNDLEEVERYKVKGGWCDPPFVTFGTADMVLASAYDSLVAEVRWKPITPTSLPKAGDEVGGRSPERGPYVEHVTEDEEVYTYGDWIEYGYSFYRSISLPEKIR